MKRTSVYLPGDLKEALERFATAERRSEADVIREAIGQRLKQAESPAPRLPLSSRRLGDPKAAERVDELLERFGRR